MPNYYLSITWLKLRHPKYLISYLIHSIQIIREIRVSKGFLKGKVLGTINLSMWTATLWTCEEASKVFHKQGTHRKSVIEISEWSSQAASGCQETNSKQLPKWVQVAALLKKKGTFYTLNQELHTKSSKKAISIPKIPIFAMCFSKAKEKK